MMMMGFTGVEQPGRDDVTRVICIIEVIAFLFVIKIMHLLTLQNK